MSMTAQEGRILAQCVHVGNDVGVVLLIPVAFGVHWVLIAPRTRIITRQELGPLNDTPRRRAHNVPDVAPKKHQDVHPVEHVQEADFICLRRRLGHPRNMCAKAS